ncbi:hypothetical protein SEA_ALAKAZAM_39 [Microbacterium phage Alakazam]|nr:hypothetical protein SEA_ALAKAZAM_39 [Microbacterium phage Alakazam]
MATARKSSKPAVEVEEEVETEETVKAPTFKQIANDAIDDAAAQLGVTESSQRYKVQRAFGFIAIQIAEEEGTLDELIAEVVSRAGDLPAGFGLEASVAAPKPEPKAKAAPAKAAARKPAAKPAAKAAPAARKRPTR